LSFRFVAQARALIFASLVVCLASLQPAIGAGALAIGKCGAYGQAYDHPAQTSALAAAKKACKGDCTTVTMNRACAALAVDMANPCGAHGYAVTPRISSTLNEATKKCYDFGGKECVIRAWACDAKG
jgi:hypothetical protein